MKFLTILSFFLLTLHSNGFAQNEAALVKKVKAKLDKVNDYRATGKMKLDVSFIKAPESTVTVYYKKPDKFKVTKQNGISILPKGGVSVNMNSLLLGDNYTVVPAGHAVVNGVNTTVVKLLPSDDNSDIVLTTLYIDDKNLVIKKSTVTTRENGSYEINLDFGKYLSYGLPDKVTFSFNVKDYKLPKGMVFEYEKGGQKKEATPKNQKGKVEITYSNYIINKGIDDKVFADNS